MAKALELAGQKFERLLVIERAESKNNRVMWKCQCDCGNTITIEGSRLVAGNTRSCGCFRRDQVKYINLTGQKFGKLTVLHLADPIPGGQARWLCQCECGKEQVIRSQCLRNGTSKSCGCLRSENARRLFKKHGQCHTKEHDAWLSMKNRCGNPNDTGYQNYGARGICVEECWKDSFEQFFEDMGIAPTGYSLERLDVNGNYGPENCIWADRRTQANNKRSNRYITYQEQTKTLAEWARHFGIKQATLYHRIFQQKWPLEEAFNPKLAKRRSVHRDYDHDFELRKKAVHAVHVALRYKKLIKPAHCQWPNCSNSDVEAHHHKGYGPEHKLDVVWLCCKHHNMEKGERITLCGITKSVGEWSDLSGLPKTTIYSRMKKPGWTPESVLLTPHPTKAFNPAFNQLFWQLIKAH